MSPMGQESLLRDLDVPFEEIVGKIQEIYRLDE